MNNQDPDQEIERLIRMGKEMRDKSEREEITLFDSISSGSVDWYDKKTFDLVFASSGHSLRPFARSYHSDLLAELLTDGTVAADVIALPEIPIEMNIPHEFLGGGKEEHSRLKLEIAFWLVSQGKFPFRIEASYDMYRLDRLCLENPL